MRHRKDLPVHSQCTRTNAHTGRAHANLSWAAPAAAENIDGGTTYGCAPQLRRWVPAVARIGVRNQSCILQEQIDGRDG